MTNGSSSVKDHKVVVIRFIHLSYFKAHVKEFKDYNKLDMELKENEKRLLNIRKSTIDLEDGSLLKNRMCYM